MANVGGITNYPLFHGFYPNGKPLIGGKLFTYQAGTATPAAVYYDAAASYPQPNPVVLNDRGEALIHVTQAMLWRLETSTGVQLWTIDNIGAGGDVIPPSTVGVNHGDVSIGLVG